VNFLYGNRVGFEPARSVVNPCCSIVAENWKLHSVWPIDSGRAAVDYSVITDAQRVTEAVPEFLMRM
jgi:hypothetical protein